MNSGWLRQATEAARDAPTVVFFPHAGGSASFYAPFARALAPGIRTLAVQYPGRLDRRGEPAIEDLRVLAHRIAVALADEPRPAALFGHSMGGLIAFEVLRTGRVDAGRLFVSGSRPPALTRVDPGFLADDAALVDEVLGLGGTARDGLAEEALRELVLPPLRADFRALSDYRPEPGARVSCPISAFVGDRDALVSVGDAGRWAEHTTAGFTLRVLPGDHFYLTPGLAKVAEAIRGDLVPV
jgi:surfactin synthase thioesterase subunit